MRKNEMLPTGEESILSPTCSLSAFLQLVVLSLPCSCFICLSLPCFCWWGVSEWESPSTTPVSHPDPCLQLHHQAETLSVSECLWRWCCLRGRWARKGEKLAMERCQKGKENVGGRQEVCKHSERY